MTCPKCGTQLLDGTKFCDICGTRLDEAPVAEQPVYSQENYSAEPQFQGMEMDMGVYTPPQYQEDGMPTPPPAKKSKLKFILIPVIAVLVLVIAGVVTAFASPAAKNFFMKLFLSPEAYMSYVVENNAGNLADDVAKVSSVAQNNFKSEMSATGNVKVTKGDGFNALMTDLGADLEDAQTYIDALKSLGIDVSTVVKGNKMSLNMGVGLNDTDITSVDMVVDMDDQAVYMAFPEINPDYIRVSIPDDSISYSSADYQEVAETMNAIVSVIPDEKVLEKLFVSYAKISADQFEEVEESKGTYQAGDISQKLTKITMTVDEEVGEKILVAVLEQLKEDEDIKNIIEKIGDIEMFKDVSDELYDEFKKGIDDMLDNTDDIGEFEFEITLLVNGKGEISGMIYDLDGGSIEYYTVRDGKKFGTVFAVEPDEGQGFKIEGSGQEDGDKESATYTVKAMDMDIVSIELKDVDTKLAEEGVFNGSIIITPSDDIPALGNVGMIKKMKLVLSSSSKSADDTNSAIEVYYSDKLVAKLEASAKLGEAKDVSVPGKYVDLEFSTQEEINEWLANVKLDEVFNNLRSAGFPSDILDMIEMQMNPVPQEEVDVELEAGDNAA